MPIAKEVATAAVKAVNSFDAISKNATAHADYHFFETSARGRVAGGNGPQRCGYYVTTSTTQVWKHRTTGEESARKPKKGSSQYARTNLTLKTSFGNTSPIARGNAISTIINKVLIPALNDYANGIYKKDNVDPDNVFHYVSPLPSGYGGVTVRRAAADVDCTHIEIIIRRNGSNWAIVTHYPSEQGHFGGLGDL